MLIIITHYKKAFEDKSALMSYNRVVNKKTGKNKPMLS